MSVAQKAYAYITRPSADGVELLVFTQHHDPASGLQPPGGTLEPGEAPAHGVLREVAEEAGLSGCRVVRLVARDTVLVQGRPQSRTFFQVTAPATPETWQHWVTGAGEDEGMRFDYRWLPQHEWGQVHPWFSEHLPLLSMNPSE